MTNAKQQVPGFPESTHHVGFCYAINWNEVFIYLWGHGHTPVYTQYSMMKNLLKLTPECLRNADAKNGLKPFATRGMIIKH